MLTSRPWASANGAFGLCSGSRCERRVEAEHVGLAWDPEQKATGSRPDTAAMLQASQQLAGAEVSCVSVDMPLAITPITSRRAADTAISSRFGPKGCAVHSHPPNAPAPSPISYAPSSPTLATPFTPIATIWQPGL